MIRTIRLAPVLGILIACTPADATAQAARDTRDARAARVDSILAATFHADGPGAAVAVVQNGRIVLERARGRAHLEYNVPITPATIFHVASVSKQFATFAIVLLEQQGKLSLDDDIRTHLPELHDFGRRITIRHLANHTSGIRDQWELLMMAGWRIDDVITRDQIMAMMRRQRELNFEPGAEYLYSNMGYTLLAEIVERASGRSFNDFLTREVFRPLGMTATHVHNDHEMVVPGRAYSYRPAAGPQSGPTVWRNAVLSYANQGATSLFTTAGDLGRWLINFETGRVGGTAAIRAMRTRGILNNGDTIPYALALQRGVHNGREHWGHGGSDAGFRSYVTHFPAERLGVIVLSNAASTNAAAMAFAIADVYLPAAPVAARPPASAATQGAPAPQPRWEPAAAELHEFTGDFYSPELATIYSIRIRDGALVATHQRLADMTLAPGTEPGSFRSGNRQIHFSRAATGAIDGFRLSGGRARNILFLRLAAGALPGR
jgi:CubicO group peptidase (beta-lactamase class C family)